MPAVRLNPSAGGAGPGQPSGGNRPGGTGPQQPGGGPSTPGNPGGGNTGPGTPGTNPGTNPGTGNGGMPGACALPPARIWALTPDQYVRTVKALLPSATITAEALAGTLAGQATASPTRPAGWRMTEPLRQRSCWSTVWQLATTAVATPAQLAPCLGEPAAPTRRLPARSSSAASPRGPSAAISTAAEHDELAGYMHARGRRRGDARPRSGAS